MPEFPPPHEPEIAPVLGRTLGVKVALAEPPPRHRDLIRARYARVLLASAGPVALRRGLSDALIARLEEARIPVVADDADVDAVRTAYWPTLGDLARLDCGAGSPAPRLVVVGESPGRLGPRRPFLARSGVWLFDALRAAGYDEMSVYATNAMAQGRTQRTQLQDLRDLSARYEPTWLAVGKKAGAALRGAEIDHVEAPHPSWHRRFRYRDGAAGYARLLIEAGVAPGPWYERDLPTTGPDASVLIERFGVEDAGAYAKRGDRERSHVSPETERTARRLYVTGEVDSVAAAARAAGLKRAEHLRDVARRDDWRTQRARYLDDVAEQAMARRAADEAKALASAKQLSVVALAQELQGIVRRQQQPDYEARPRNAAQLARTASTLHDLADRQVPEEREVSRRSLREQLEELQRTVEEQYGPLD